MTSKAVFGPIHLTIAASAVCGWPASRKRDGVIAQLPDRRDLAVAFDQREGHALIGGDRRVERGARLRVLPRLVERSLGAAHALQRDQRAAEVEAAHDVGKALVFLAEPVLDGYANALEEDRAAADDVAADIVEAGARDAGRIRGNDQRGDPAAPLSAEPVRAKTMNASAQSAKVIDVFSPSST